MDRSTIPYTPLNLRRWQLIALAVLVFAAYSFIEQRYYTWFTGFAPSRPMPGVPQVAIAALVVNEPTWKVKANGVARDMLRAYFADAGVPGVHRAKTRAVATRHGH